MESQHIGHAHSQDSPCIGHILDQTSLDDTHIHQEQYNFHERNYQRKWLQKGKQNFVNISNRSFSVTKSLGKNETYVYGKTFPSILLHKYIAKGLHKIRSDNQVRSRICHKVLQTFQFKTHFKIDSKLKRKCFVQKLTIPPHIHIGLVQCNFHFGKKCH